MVDLEKNPIAATMHELNKRKKKRRKSKHCIYDWQEIDRTHSPYYDPDVLIYDVTFECKIYGKIKTYEEEEPRWGWYGMFKTWISD